MFWMFLLQPSTHTSIQYYTHGYHYHCWTTHLPHGFFFHHTHRVNERSITNIGPHAVESPRRKMTTSDLVGDFNFDFNRNSFVLSSAFYQLVVVVVIIGIGIVDMCILSVLALCSLLVSLRKERRIHNCLFYPFQLQNQEYKYHSFSITQQSISTKFVQQRENNKTCVEDQKKKNCVQLGEKKIAGEVGRRKWNYLQKRTTYNGGWRKNSCCNSMVTFLQNFFN